MGSATSAVSPWFATSSLNANELRYALAALLGCSPTNPVASEAGVIPGPAGADPFAPVSNGSSSAPRVSVAPGACVIQRPTGGTYVGTWDVAQNILLDTPLPSSGQTRWDLLVADITDDEADAGSATSDRVKLRVRTVTGTPSSSPTTPATPAGAIPLFRMRVSNAGAITNIESLRPWTRTQGAPRLVEDGDTRAGSHPSDLRIFRSGQIDAWVLLGSTWQWLTIVQPAVWKTVDSPLVYAGAGSIAAGTVNPGSGGSMKCTYKLAGKDLSISWTALFGSGTGGGAGQITGLLPDNLVAAASVWFPAHVFTPGEAAPINSSRADVSGMAYVPAGSGIVYPFFPIGVIPGDSIDLREAPLQNAGSTGTRGSGVPRIPNGFPLISGSALHMGSALIPVQ